jgi:hypothetical protein
VRQVRRPSARGGSLAVEAAIFLPLFLIGVMTVGWLIQMVSVSEQAFHSLADETGALAAEASLPVLSPAFKNDAEKRIRDENGWRMRSLSLSPVLYRVPYIDTRSGTKHTDLISVSATWDMPIPLPPIFQRGLKSGGTVLCRAFVGKDNKATPMPFSEMEQNEDGTIVWVFPRAGERYHGEDCVYIKNNPREMLLTSQVRRSYDACSLCKPNAAGEGSLVYVFPRAGDAYHSGSCHIVERYVISVSEKDAQKDGYTACGKCGGK